MGPEVVTILVGGARWTAFEQITVRAAFDEAARAFTFVAAAELGSSPTNRIFAKGTPVQIFANDDLVLTGYVNRKQPKFDAESAQITVSGRSASADLVDGSAEHETGRFKDKTPLEIGQEVSRNYRGTGFVTDQKLDKVEQYQLTPGETCHRCVEKMTRQQGMTITGTADGRAMITKAGARRHAGALIEGVNILTGESDHNDSNQHSKYSVRGQRPFGHGVDNLEIEAVATDKTVKRHRPVVIVQDDDTTKDHAKKRAKNRRDRAAGNALKATISVQGWRDDAGKLWNPGWLIWTESPFLDIAQDMLIESVDLAQNEDGSIAFLSLTDPRSYGGKGGKGNKSGGEWSQDDGDAE